MACVYLITHTASRRVYVGKTISDPRKRWSGHKRDAARGHSKGGVDKAIHEYGAGEFSFRVIEQCDSDERALDLERRWIRLFDATNQAKGFNRCLGGQRGPVGFRHTAESRAKMGLSGAAHPQFGKRGPGTPAWGLKRTAETRAKMSAARKGWVPSEDTRRKIGDAQRGKPSRRLGKKCTPESKERMSVARTGVRLSEAHRAAIGNGVRGTKHTAEARENMSIAAKAREAKKREARDGVH